jgi:hypothetical protein
MLNPANVATGSFVPFTGFNTGFGNPFFNARNAALNGFTPFGSTFGYPFSSGAGLGSSLYGNPLSTLGYAGMYASGYANPYGYSGGYGGGGYGGGGYGNGSNMAGTPFEVSQQEAYLLQEKVRAERVDNRRKLFDEYLYENEKAITPEDERKKFASLELERSRNDPPVTEIQSGKALNVLLADLTRLGKSADWVRLQGFPLPAEGALLQQINVTQTGSNIGLLRNHGKFTWPIVFDSPELQAQREALTMQAQEAVRQAEAGGSVDQQLLANMGRAVTGLRSHLRTRAITSSSSDYLDGSRFLTQFGDAIRALEQSDAANHFNGVFRLKGVKTAAELVERMNGLGLSFAPAIAGDESAYRALHYTLAACDRALVEGTEVR